MSDDTTPPWLVDEDTPSVRPSSHSAPTPTADRTPTSSSSDSWMIGEGFDTGMEGDPNPNEGANLRWWVPKGETRTAIFVTEGKDAPVLWEHNGQIDGNWKNWASCLEPLGMPCDLCKYANANKGAWKRYKGRFFTVIDLTEFKDRMGRVRSRERRLMCVKKDVSEIIQRKYMSRRDAGEGLRGAMFKIFRPDSDKSASTGEDFEFVKMVNLLDYGFSEDPNKGFLLPDGQFDIARLLKPDPAKIKIMVDKITGGFRSPDKYESRGTDSASGPSVRY